jgi:hypothetical protein
LGEDWLATSVLSERYKDSFLSKRLSSELLKGEPFRFKVFVLLCNPNGNFISSW